jgi:hypothetical protein
MDKEMIVPKMAKKDTFLSIKFIASVRRLKRAFVRAYALETVFL